MSDVVVIIVVVRMKIACLGDLGTWATSKVNEYVEIGEKMASVYFESFCTDHKRLKYCNLSHVRFDYSYQWHEEEEAGGTASPLPPKS